MNIPANIKVVLDKLNFYGYEAYVVGGCVRDSLLNKEPQDWDVTTSATPDPIMKIFSGNIMIDNECFTLKQLAINGTDVAGLGFKGKHIGIILNDCLAKIIGEQLENNKETLLAHIKQNFGM